MIFKKQPPEENRLDVRIDKLLFEMDDHHGDTEEYAKMVKQLTKLYAIQNQEKETLKSKSISKDTLLIVAGNLIGILMITDFERARVVTSKGLQLLAKLK